MRAAPVLLGPRAAATRSTLAADRAAALGRAAAVAAPAISRASGRPSSSVAISWATTRSSVRRTSAPPPLAAEATSSATPLRERPHLDHHFLEDGEAIARRHHDFGFRRRVEPGAHRRQRVLGQPVEVVEHQDDLAARRERRPDAARVGSARERHRVHDARLVARARQIAEQRRGPRSPSHPAQRVLHGERRLADASWSEQGDVACALVEARRQHRELGLAAEERNRAGHRGQGHGITLPQKCPETCPGASRGPPRESCPRWRRWGSRALRRE